MDTGYKPFVVEIKIHGGAGEVRLKSKHRLELKDPFLQLDS